MHQIEMVSLDSLVKDSHVYRKFNQICVMLPISQAAINGVMSLSFIHFFSKTAGGR